MRLLAKRVLLGIGLADRAATINRCGIALTEPDGNKKGVFLLNGTRLTDFDLVWRRLRQRYVIVLTHHWALQDYLLREYNKRARRFDCVISPNEECDRLLSFAPIFRSNSVDLLVDDQMWPRLNGVRDIDVVDSVAVPWLLKQPIKWLDEVQRHLDRKGAGRAVYVLKRAPNAKEDDECRRQFDLFRRRLSADARIELRIGVEQREMCEIYNRAKVIYHPSNSEFGCRSILEAMYCGAWAVVEPYDWARAASTDSRIQALVRVQQGLDPLPTGELPDIRQWMTANGVRTRLIEFLGRTHDVSATLRPFTMFSHVHIHSTTGVKTDM